MSLVLLSEYKEVLGITGSDEDEFVELTQCEVENKVKDYLCRDLEAQDYTEILDGSSEKVIIPSQFPINSVSKIEFYDGLDSNDDEEWDEQVQGDDYERLVIPTHKESIIIDGATFPKGMQNIRLTYNAGFSTIPYPIQQACKKLMLLYYGEVKKNKTLGKSSVSEASGFTTTTTYDLQAEERILDGISMYRNLNV